MNVLSRAIVRALHFAFDKIGPLPKPFVEAIFKRNSLVCRLGRLG